jgi:predicted nucleic acid-binding protein
MVGIDANILSLFLYPTASVPNDFKTKQPIDKAHERAEFLIADLQGRGETILIPTPALSEVLVVAPDINRYVQILQTAGCFKIAGFGERAAVEVALRLQLALKTGDKAEGILAPWQKVKYDRQIVAICKVEGCSCIYSADEDIHKHAQLWNIPVLNLSDVKLGGQTKLDLVDGAEDDESPSPNVPA